MNKANKTPEFQTLLLSATKLWRVLALTVFPFTYTSVIQKIFLDFSCAWVSLCPCLWTQNSKSSICGRIIKGKIIPQELLSSPVFFFGWYRLFLLYFSDMVNTRHFWKSFRHCKGQVMLKWFWKHHKVDESQIFGCFNACKELALHSPAKALAIRTWTLKNSNQRSSIKSGFQLLGVWLGTNLPPILATAGTLLFKIIYCAAWHSSLIENSL